MIYEWLEGSRLAVTMRGLELGPIENASTSSAVIIGS